jgi:signal transduction histidine kinase
VRLQTLAGRLALVQSGLTLLALAAVIVGTWLALTSLLERRRDAILQETAHRGVEAVRMLGVYAQDAEWMERELGEIRPTEVRVELQDPTGFVLASSGPDFAPGVARLGCYASGDLRACAAKAGIFTIIAASNKAPDREERDRFLAALLVVSVFAGALALLTSRLVARRTLRPLTDLTTAISSIEPGENAPLGTPMAFVELEGLRARFDELLVRFHQALARERRLTAQASHELRTPLGVARGEIEALSNTGDFEAGRTRALAALDRLHELVEVLLWFARVQEPLDEECLGIVNLADVVRAEVTQQKPAMASMTLSCELPDEALVRGDERLLRRVTANLIDNAVKHGDGGQIDLVASVSGSRVLLRVSNTGLAPSLTLKERLFEPFYRGQHAVTGISGFGLGLPFARAVARAHAGDVELVEANSERTVFVLTLPLVHWTTSQTPSNRSTHDTTDRAVDDEAEIDPT